MRVRRATPRDVSRIGMLAGRLFVEDSGTRDPHADVSWPATPQGREYYGRHVVDDDSCVLLAGDPAAGFLVGGLRPRDPLRPGILVADLQSMFVLPASRCGGVGTALVVAFRTWARSRGVDVLTVTASAANGGARRFYAAHGFGEHTITLEAAVNA